MKKTAFTLIELLVVITIIAVLVALLLPAFTSASNKSKQSRCAANLKQIFMAMNMFSQDRDGAIVYNLNDPYDGWTWVEAIAPYLQKITVSQNVRPSSVFACPASMKKTQAGEYSDYGKNIFVSENLKVQPSNGLWTPPKFNPRTVNLEQPSKTMALADGTGRDLQVWLTDFGFSYRHSGRSNILYYDGHVEPMEQKNMTGGGSDDIYKYPWSPIATK